MANRRLLLALGASLLAHGALFGSDLWHFSLVPPGQTAPEPVLTATLLPARPVAPPPEEIRPVPPRPVAAPPRSKPVRQAEAAATKAEPTRLTPPPRQLIPDVDAPEEFASLAPGNGGALPVSTPLPVAEKDGAVDNAPPAEAFSIDGWPAQGSISFRVFLGEKRLEVGEASHSWSHDDDSYRMDVNLRTTGLLALVRGFQYSQHSEGGVGPQGLQPRRFSVQQQGKEPETALFDWQAGRVSIRRGERERRSAGIQPGDQDVLSLWHQIGIVGTAGLPRPLTVVSNKEAKIALLEAVGDEGLRLPIGRVDTLRLRAQAEDGSLTIDIWLARNYGMLPVRIRMTDDKGEVLDQQATHLRLAQADGNKGGERELAAVQKMVELKEEKSAEAPNGLFAN